MILYILASIVFLSLTVAEPYVKSSFVNKQLTIQIKEFRSLHLIGFLVFFRPPKNDFRKKQTFFKNSNDLILYNIFLKNYKCESIPETSGNGLDKICCTTKIWPQTAKEYPWENVAQKCLENMVNKTEKILCAVKFLQ